MGWVSVGGLGGAMCAGWCGGTLSRMLAVVVLFSASVRVFAGACRSCPLVLVMRILALIEKKKMYMNIAHVPLVYRERFFWARYVIMITIPLPPP